jgi:hypothetical protein
MSLTRAQLEVVLLRRVGKLYAAVRLDGTTQDGSNVDLTDPLAATLRQLGIALASPLAVVDADLVDFPVAKLDALLDLAELRALESAHAAAAALVDASLGDLRKSFGQTARALEARITTTRSRIAERHGTALLPTTNSAAAPFAPGLASSNGTPAFTRDLHQVLVPLPEEL